MNTGLPFPAEFNKECTHKPILPFSCRARNLAGLVLVTSPARCSIYFNSTAETEGVTVLTVLSQLCHELPQFNINKSFHSCRRLCVSGQQMVDRSWCSRRGPVCTLASGQL